MSKVAQVRLNDDEWEELREAMRFLRISSTSDALREAIRALRRQTTELAAASEITEFYRGRLAPAPDGVLPVTQEDLDAADRAEF